MIHLQIERLKQENNPDLQDIIALLEADDYERLHKAIEIYVADFKSAELTPHQKAVFDEIILELDQVIKNYDYDNPDMEASFLSLNGSAGVGKTFVTSKLVQAFLEKDYKVVLTTPTHKSLSVAKYMINSAGMSDVTASTLHSFLNIKLDYDYLAGTKVFKRDRKKLSTDYEKNRVA
jgi:Cdc6-like AAA superfamily ATPase